MISKVIVFVYLPGDLQAIPDSGRNTSVQSIFKVKPASNVQSHAVGQSIR